MISLLPSCRAGQEVAWSQNVLREAPVMMASLPSKTLGADMIQFVYYCGAASLEYSDDRNGLANPF
jgi:hypothetical protein